MNVYNKLFISMLLVVLSAFAFGCGADLSAETSGQITRVALDRDTKTKKRKTSSNRKRKTTKTTYETEIDYSYTVGGKTYSGYSEKDGDVQRDFIVGSAAKVCYNPKDPEESDVFPSSHRCD